MVVPTPEVAQGDPNYSCYVPPPSRPVPVCVFGVGSTHARATVALLGDSHARQWRAGLEVVAEEARWHVDSLTRSGCPFTTAPLLYLGEPADYECERFNHRVIAWLRLHPKIDTAFVAEWTVRFPTAPSFPAFEHGYVDAWRALPQSVKHIVVIRDNPAVSYTHLTLPTILRV